MINVPHRQILLLLALGMLLPGADLQGAGKVIPREERLLLLEESMASLQREDDRMSLTRYNAIRYPFSFTDPRNIEKEEPSQKEKTAEPEPVAKVSDRAILAAVAQNLRPTGSIIRGEQRLLTMPGGRLLKEGATLPVRFRGNQYRLIIREIRPDGYTLGIGDASIEQSFSEFSKENIRRYQGN